MRWIESTFKTLISGLGFFALIVSATALLRLVESLFGHSFGGALERIIDAYQNLFYPLINLTVGNLLSVLSIDISNSTRDAIVLYLIVSSAISRLFHRRLFGPSKNELKRKVSTRFRYALIVVTSILWPVAVPLIMAWMTLAVAEFAKNYDGVVRTPSGVEGYRWFVYSSSFQMVLLPILLEAAKVIGIALVAVVFNEADIL